ncbi:Type III restriction-modification system methylase (M.HindVIP) [Canicola haemoglobinophilus]|uniref:Type III restriction-modification system methylase (M.HindVIP) n=1 Tax=Canicola haemoglobinophilus TaxID=733 RepID=A0AB38HA71_9PAST|nr:Type III restriction-modification system methylase (M.HindVIP) [Canicola haemoglobinophilus]
MNKNLQDELKKALQSFDDVWANEEKTELAHNLLLDKLEQHDREILAILLKNDELKRHFFVDIDGVFVFKQADFQFFLSQNKVSHSYTKYKNHIGLTDGSRFLKDSTDIVLDFPFKDCILSGGQSSEESEETYFERNNTTAQHSTAQHSTAQQNCTRKKQENVKKFSSTKF